MMASGYSAQRSDLAKKGGLGRKPLNPVTTEVVVQQIPEGAKGRRGPAASLRRKRSGSRLVDQRMTIGLSRAGFRP